jgi:hypothetical protein
MSYMFALDTHTAFPVKLVSRGVVPNGIGGHVFTRKAVC